MSRVTKKLQVSVPKALADRYDIQPGDDLEWQPAGEILRVIPPGRQSRQVALSERVRLFDEATERQRERESREPVAKTTERGWTRDDLYDRAD